MLKLRIKSIFNSFLLIIFFSFIKSQSIYIDNPKTISYSFVSTYLKHKKINNLYDYSFDLRFINKNFELVTTHYMNKQNPTENDTRSNDYSIYSFKYHYKIKEKYIFGLGFKKYHKYKLLDDLQSYTFLISRHYYSQESDLTYYPYIEYEIPANEDNLIFSPNYLYLGCIIKDGDIFVEPFLRINNKNYVKYSGIKLGVKI